MKLKIYTKNDMVNNVIVESGEFEFTDFYCYDDNLLEAITYVLNNGYEVKNIEIIKIS